MEKKEYKWFCDLDGVLINFNKGYFDLTGIDLGRTHRTDPKFFEPITKAGIRYWNNLEWMEDGKELWEYIKKYTPELLSAPTRDYSSIIGKKLWVRRELPGVHLILRSAKHKKDLATPDSILIDDREDNIKGWIENGGIGIHHKNTNDTIKQIKTLNI